MSIAPDALLTRGAPAARPDRTGAPTGLPRRLVEGVRRRLLAVLMALALLAAGVVGVLWRGTGYTSAVTDLSSGAIWLANTNGGLVTMINGNTNEAVWRIPLAEPGAPLTTVQLDDGAAVLDHTTGALTRISTRTLTVTATATVEPGEAGFAARDGQLYLFPADAGLPVTRRDPATLASLGELAIPGGTDGVVDQDGRLWVLEAERATLHLVPADRPAVSRAITGAETATLTPIAGGVALIRPDGAVTRATPAGEDNLTVRAEQLSITATGWSAVQAADELPDRLLLLDPDGARLGSCPASGDCTLISLAPYAGPTDAFGTAQYAGGVVFVPVHSTGQVILVDVATGTVRQQVPVVEQPAPFELTAARDAIWFNNPVTNEAGKIAGDGTVTKILKYPDELDDNGVRALVAGGPGPIGRNEGIGAGGGTGTGPGGGADEGAIDTEAPDAPDTAETDDAAAVSTTTTTPVAAPPTTAADASTNPPVTSTTLAGPDGDDGGIDPDGAAPPPTAPSGRASPSPSTGSTSTTVGSSPPPSAGAAPPPADGETAADPAAPAKPLPTPGPNQTTEGQRRDEPPPPSNVLEAKMALSSTTVEPNVDLQLRDISTGDPDSRLWDFGDGTTATEAAPRHRWSRPGSYTITLNVRKGGEERTARQPIQVTSELVASFTAPTTARVGEPVTFTNTSSGDITSYLWDFGDGTTSTDRRPSHTYATMGDVSVTLRVSDGRSERSNSQPLNVLDAARPTGAFRLEESPPPSLQVGAAARLAIVVERGGAVTASGPSIGADDPGSPCWLEPETNAVVVHAARAGTCTLTLTQASSPDELAAPPQTHTLQIVGRANQAPVIRPTAINVPAGSRTELTAAALGVSDPDGDPVQLLDPIGTGTDVPEATLVRVGEVLVLTVGNDATAGLGYFSVTDGVSRTAGSFQITIDELDVPPVSSVGSVVAEIDYRSVAAFGAPVTVISWPPVQGAIGYRVEMHQDASSDDAAIIAAFVGGNEVRCECTYLIPPFVSNFYSTSVFSVVTLGPGGEESPASPRSNACFRYRVGTTGQFPASCEGFPGPPLPAPSVVVGIALSSPTSAQLTLAVPSYEYGPRLLTAECFKNTDGGPDGAGYPWSYGRTQGIGVDEPLSTTAVLDVTLMEGPGNRLRCRSITHAYHGGEEVASDWLEIAILG